MQIQVSVQKSHPIKIWNESKIIIFNFMVYFLRVPGTSHIGAVEDIGGMTLLTMNFMI